MESKKISKVVEITSEAIKKKFQNAEPEKAIFELTWNGLDAGANLIEINIERNDLDGLELITIFDNGSGIDFSNDNNGFFKFDVSNKKNMIDAHGKDGIGRFSFHRLCHDATWFTKTLSGNFKLPLNESSMQNLNIEPVNMEKLPKDFKNHTTGTLVELKNFSGKKTFPNNEVLRDKLSVEFGWLIAFKPDIKIRLNDIAINIPNKEEIKSLIEIDGFKFDYSIFRWFEKPTSEQSYLYFINEKNQLCDKELSKFNKKPPFYASVIIKSINNNIFDNEFGELEGNEGKIIEIKEIVNTHLKEVYENFLRVSADNLINDFDEKGYFNYFHDHDKDYENWRINATKQIVKEICLKDPFFLKNLKEKPTKILIRLIDRLLISNENDALFEVLNEVLELDENSLNSFSKLLQRTKLENIVKTIEVISQRLEVIRKLKILMREKYKNILETPDLQSIIESNTWLFGDQYAVLGQEEDDFNKIAKNLRKQIKGIDEVELEDIDNDVTVKSTKRQVDLFLASKQMVFDEIGNKIFKCVIIEIKKPAISLNKKHLRQLEDYAEIISKHPEFSSSDFIRFELILVGRKLSDSDTSISDKIETAKIYQEKGLISKTNKIKCYVRDWFSILHELELSNEYLIEKLKPKLPDFTQLTDKQIVEDLQKALAS